MFDEEKIKEFADTYGASISSVQKYCETLLSYPFIISGDDEYFFECLEKIIIESSKRDVSKAQDYFELVEECVYKIYGDDSVPYLSDSFKEKNDIEEV